MQMQMLGFNYVWAGPRDDVATKTASKLGASCAIVHPLDSSRMESSTAVNQ